MRLGHPNLVVRLPTPEEQWARAKQKKGSPWVSAHSTASSPLTSESYIKRVLTELAKGEHKMGPGRLRSDRHPVRLVHDKDSVHTSDKTAAFASKHKIELTELPPRSPDLDPLDFGVFGAVKKKWVKEVSKGNLDWEAQCSLFIEMLQEVDASAQSTPCPAGSRNALSPMSPVGSVDVKVM